MEERRNNRKVESRLKDACATTARASRSAASAISACWRCRASGCAPGVVEGSTSQCPHCQGTGIVRSTESVALAVLRALEDQLLRDARGSLTAVTTAEVALYILNNKRTFVTDMERRYGVTITVQASERMQGANFAIEKSAAARRWRRRPPSGRLRQHGVGLRGPGGGRGGEESRPAPAGEREREGEAGRPRRRRRRGRREDRGDERPRHREGERAEFARNGEADEIEREEAGGAEPSYARGDHVEASDEVAGSGDQPVVGNGEEGTAEAREDRRPRRRRGRRGGRRGRDRDEGPRERYEEAHAGEAGDSNGSEAPLHEAHASPMGEAGERTETAGDVRADEPVREEAAPRRERHHAEATPEPAWHAPAAEHAGNGGPRERVAEPAAAEPVRQREPEPVHAEPVRAEPAHVEPVHAEPAPEEPSRPARRGWWQLRK